MSPQSKRRPRTAAEIWKNFFFLLDFVFDAKSAAIWLVLWLLFTSVHAFLHGESSADIALLAVQSTASTVGAIALLLILAAVFLPIRRAP